MCSTSSAGHHSPFDTTSVRRCRHRLFPSGYAIAAKNPAMTDNFARAAGFAAGEETEASSVIPPPPTNRFDWTMDTETQITSILPMQVQGQLSSSLPDNDGNQVRSTGVSPATTSKTVHIPPSRVPLAPAPGRRVDLRLLDHTSILRMGLANRLLKRRDALLVPMPPSPPTTTSTRTMMQTAVQSWPSVQTSP